MKYNAAIDRDIVKSITLVFSDAINVGLRISHGSTVKYRQIKPKICKMRIVSVI